jgi:hypothetical protein
MPGQIINTGLDEVRKDIEQALLDAARYIIQDKKGNKAIVIGDNADELYEKLVNHENYQKEGSSTTGIKKVKKSIIKDFKAAVKQLQLKTGGKTPVLATITSIPLYGPLELYDRHNITGLYTAKKTLKPLIDKYKVKIDY